MIFFIYFHNSTKKKTPIRKKIGESGDIFSFMLGKYANQMLARLSGSYVHTRQLITEGNMRRTRNFNREMFPNIYMQLETFYLKNSSYKFNIRYDVNIICKLERFQHNILFVWWCQP